MVWNVGLDIKGLLSFPCTFKALVFFNIRRVTIISHNASSHNVRLIQKQLNYNMFSN